MGAVLQGRWVATQGRRIDGSSGQVHRRRPVHPGWPSAFSNPHWLEADLGSTQHGYSICEFQVNGS
jgi:hypothetical protein